MQEPNERSSLGIDGMKIVTTTKLRQMVRRSEKAGLSRLPNELLWSDIDRDGRHVLNPMPMPGEYRFVRTFALCKVKDSPDPAEVFIDVTPQDWERLPEESNG